jgi:hypothetical protein
VVEKASNSYEGVNGSGGKLEVFTSSLLFAELFVSDCLLVPKFVYDPIAGVRVDLDIQ